MPQTPAVLEEFYAVTETSVYHAKNNDGKGYGYPIVLKIAVRGHSQLPVGSHLTGGYLVSIGKQLIMFVPEGSGWFSPATTYERQIEKVNTRWWGGNTSSVVALFLTKQEAMRCFESSALQSCDTRWLEQTKEVMRRIGRDHPNFVVCEYPSMRLLDTSEIWPTESNKDPIAP